LAVGASVAVFAIASGDAGEAAAIVRATATEDALFSNQIVGGVAGSRQGVALGGSRVAVVATGGFPKILALYIWAPVVRTDAAILRGNEERLEVTLSHKALAVHVLWVSRALPVAGALATVPKAYSPFVAFARVTGYGTEGLLRWLWRGAHFGVKRIDALVALLEQALPVCGRNGVVRKGTVAGTGSTGPREKDTPIGKCLRGTGHRQPLLVEDGLGDLTVGCIAVASVFWATELKAEGGGREPVLLAHAAKLTGPVSQKVVVVAGTTVDLLQTLPVEAALGGSTAAVGTTASGVEPARIALAHGGGPRKGTGPMPATHRP